MNRTQCVRPTQYTVIDKLGTEFDEAIHRIKAESQIGVAVTGMNVGRHGQLCWIQVNISELNSSFQFYLVSMCQ